MYIFLLWVSKAHVPSFYNVYMSVNMNILKIKLCKIFSPLISFYNRVTHLVGGKAVDIVYLELSKAFDIVSHRVSPVL